MRVLVTGIGGFVGVPLAEDLLARGHEVMGVGIQPAPPRELLDRGVAYLTHDLAVGWPDVRADAVIHLAGLSAVGPSFSRPQEYLQVNTAMITHLAEGVLAQQAATRLIVVGSGAVYAPSENPLSESSPTLPTSPYAVSKLAVESQSAYYRHRGLEVCVMRPFNHVGPRQRSGFVLPDLVDRVRAAVAAGGPIRVGDLETARDYTDVRDVARAYRMAVEASSTLPKVLNVCSGRSRTGRELLSLVSRALGVSTPPTELDPSLVRPGEQRVVTGDATLARDAIGWSPSIALDQSVVDAVTTR